MKNHFSAKIAAFGNPLRWLLVPLVAMAIGLAIAQEPTADTPLIGGFRIDFGDRDQTGGIQSEEVLRTFAGTSTAEDQSGLGLASEVKPSAGSPQKAVANPPAGLATDALPFAFPVATPQSGPNKGPATLVHAGEMIGFSRDLGDGVQAITIINASRRWMAVYHIDSSGQIRLTSSRPLDADFTIQFNAAAPLPDDIRRLQGK